MNSKIEKVLNEYKEGNISLFLAIKCIKSLIKNARNTEEYFETIVGQEGK